MENRDLNHPQVIQIEVTVLTVSQLVVYWIQCTLFSSLFTHLHLKLHFIIILETLTLKINFQRIHK